MKLRTPTVNEMIEDMQEYGHVFDDSAAVRYVLSDSVHFGEHRGMLNVSFVTKDYKKEWENSAPLWTIAKVHSCEDQLAMVELAKDKDLYPGNTFVLDNGRVYQVEYSGKKRILKRKEHLERYAE